MANKMFKMVEVIGATKNAAKDEAPVTLLVDATQKYNKWAKNNVVTDESRKEWFKEYLKAKKLDDKAGVGAYIVTQTGIADTRERPYHITDVKHEAKTHTAEHFYVLRDATGNEVGREKTKNAARQAVREYITDFKEDVNVFHEWVPKEKNALALVGKYTPSKGAQPYKIIAFGYVNVD